MSEKRFVGQMCMDKLLVHFEDRDSEQNIPPIATIKDMEIVDKLNEQQELIEELHISDNMGWGRAEKFEKELKQKKIYIKRLEYKVQKFKEMNSEQQATISKLEEEKGYWKSKAMTLLMQVRRLTPRMSAKEVIEFGKELEDE